MSTLSHDFFLLPTCEVGRPSSRSSLVLPDCAEAQRVVVDIAFITYLNFTLLSGEAGWGLGVVLR